MESKPTVTGADAAVALRLLVEACRQSGGSGLSVAALRSYLAGLRRRTTHAEVGELIGLALDHLVVVERQSGEVAKVAAVHTAMDIASLVAQALDGASVAAGSAAPFGGRAVQSNSAVWFH